jgi:hypothetical protein
MVDESATGQVKEAGSEVAQRAAESVGQVAESVKEQAAAVGQEVAAQSQEFFNRAKDQLRQQGEDQARQAAAGLRRLSEQSSALAEGRVEASGPLGDYARQASERIDGFASRLERRGAQGLFEDLEDFARRRPALFLVGAVGAGFGVGRLVRAARAGTPSEHSAPSPGPRTTPALDPWTSTPPAVPGGPAGGVGL